MSRSIVFFDLDGTLSDTMTPLIYLFVRLIVEHFGVPLEVARERIPELLKLVRPEREAGLQEMAGASFTENNKTYREQLAAGMATLPVDLFPEVAGVLRRLRELDYRLVLTTNSTFASLPARLASAGIGEAFTLVYGTDLDAGMTKGPDHIRRAEQALGMTTEQLAGQSVLVGDAESDMAIAKTAGMVAIGRITDGNSASLREAGADYLINDLLELEPILEELSLASK